MIVPRTLRWRLQAWYGALLAALLAGFGWTAWRLEHDRQVRRIDEELQALLPVLVRSQHPDRRDRERRVLDVRPADAELFDRGIHPVYYVVWLRHGVPMTPSARAPAEVPMPAPGDPPMRSRGTLREAFLFPGPGDCVLVGRDLAEDLSGLRQFALRLGAAGTGVLLLGLAVGSLLAGRALRPVREIAAAAERIAAGDLARRVSRDGSDSELDRLASVLNTTFSRLEAAFAQQSRFSADAAHELRTPLTVILTHVDNAREEACANPAHAEALDAVRRAARRMRGMIESLLQLARLDAGQEPMRHQPCDLADLARESLDLVRPLAGERGLALESALRPAPVRGDPALLAQVIDNLLSNAVHHSPPGTRVRVSTECGEGFCRVTVWNEAPVIPPGELPGVFDRFTRGDPARRGSGPGHSGLGLAIAKAIAEAHAGRVEAASAEGEGTTFRLVLPHTGG